MPIKTHTCATAVCDVCGNPLTDYETEGTLHFPTAQDARAAARDHRWPVTIGARLVCDADDAEHAAELDALMPPEPQAVPDGQLDFDGREAR
ncbi:hypothetical protein ACXZ65_34500 [Streptomyces aculeolatus]